LSVVGRQFSVSSGNKKNKMEVTIPKPCSEDWNEMTPKERGRLCDKCCKVVVDFTEKTTEQIVDFISGQSGARVCGRFRAEQVTVPVQKKIRRFKIFLAALYFVFGGLLFTGCNNDVKGGNGNNGHEFYAWDVAVVDTLHPHNQNNGDTTKKMDTTKPKTHHPKNQNNIHIKQPLMGKVCIRPADTAKNSYSK